MRHVIRLKLSYAQHELKKLEHKGMLIDYLINAVFVNPARMDAIMNPCLFYQAMS